MINMVLLKCLSVICLLINNKVCLHNDSLFDHFKEIIFKIMASVSVGERKESLFFLWREYMKTWEEQVWRRMLKEFMGVLKMKHECMPEEVLIHINEKDLQGLNCSWERRRSQELLAGDGGSSRSGH